MSDYKLKKSTQYLFGEDEYHTDELREVTNPDKELMFLRSRLEVTKSAKAELIGRQLHIQDAIIELIKENSQSYTTDGTNTYHLPDGNRIKTVEKVNYRVNEDNLAALMQKIPLERLPIKVTYGVMKKDYKQLEFIDPDAFTMMQELRVIEANPSKTTQVRVVQQAMEAAETPGNIMYEFVQKMEEE